MYRNITNKDKQNLFEYSDLIEGFTTTAMEMLVQRMNVRVILRTDLASFLLFRQVLEMSDAIYTLIAKGCVNASMPLVRSLLEYYFQLAYLYEDNEERKALQFLYHYEIRKKEYYTKLAFPQEAGSYFQKLKEDKHLKGMDISDGQKETYKQNIKKIDETIKAADYRKIEIEYKRVEDTKKDKKVRYWYELFNGPTSIYGIAIKLKEPAFYEFIYRECSSYSHGEDIVHTNLEPYDEKSLGIAGLRDVRQLYSVGTNAVLLIERCSMLFLKQNVENKKVLAEKFFPYVQKAQDLYRRNN